MGAAATGALAREVRILMKPVELDRLCDLALEMLAITPYLCRGVNQIRDACSMRIPPHLVRLEGVAPIH